MARILIADDDRFIRKATALLVEKLGHIAIISPDGQHAYETLCADDRIQLVITDLMMPRIDGKQLIKLMKQDERLSKIPIIAVSAVESMKGVAELIKIGVSIFEPKPISLRTLKDRIDSCLLMTTN